MSAKSETTAANIMVEARVTIMPDASLRDALDLMVEHRVSGLPVVNAMEHCIGVISASDILNAEHEHIAEEIESLGAYFDADTQCWETIRVAANDERLSDIRVLEVMSRDLVSVDDRDSLDDVAKTMVDKDVHRVVVLDSNNSLMGIITAFDFVKQAVAAE